MHRTTGFWLGVGVVIAALIIAGIFFLVPHTAVAPGSIATSTSQTSTTITTTDLGNGISVTGTGGATIEVVPIDNSVPKPDLTHQTQFSSDLSPDIVAQLKSQIAINSAAINKDPTNGTAWLQLGVDYKIAGDYSAAEQVWIYLTKVAPTSFIAFANLGDLYQNFKVNYPKAEVNYLAAVKLKPDDIDLYRNLFTLYHSQYKTNTTAAADIIVQGLKANPNNSDLLQLQAQLKSGS